MTAPAIDLGALIQAYRIGLRHMSGAELAHEAARDATPPRSPLADDMRHLVESELEYRRAVKHAAHRQRFEASGKLRETKAACVVGGVVELGPYDRDDAEFMAGHMVESGGMPRTAVKVKAVR